MQFFSRLRMPRCKKWRDGARHAAGANAFDPMIGAGYQTRHAPCSKPFSVDPRHWRTKSYTMSFNTFGHMFRVTTFGESHGTAIGCVVDGCPPRIPLTEADIQPYLDKRRPG